MPAPFSYLVQPAELSSDRFYTCGMALVFRFDLYLLTQKQGRIYIFVKYMCTCVFY